MLALCAVGSALGYRALRNSSLFAVHKVVVSGANPSLTSQVETAVRSAIGGRSLLAVSSGSLARAIEQVPGVHVARVDRDFPSTLRVRVWPEHPVAIAVSGHDRVLVSSTGRVLATIGRRSRPPDLPRVGLPGHGVPHPGAYIENPQVLTQITAAASIPATSEHSWVGFARIRRAGCTCSCTGRPCRSASARPSIWGRSCERRRWCCVPTRR